MRIVLLASAALIFYSSCSSSTENTTGEGASDKVRSQNSAGKVVQVNVVDKNKLRLQGLDPGSEKYDKALLNAMVADEKKWYAMRNEYKDYALLADKSVSQLKRKLKNASAAEATVLIEVLSQKGESAVSTLIKSLNDKRTAVFKEENTIYWYEEKNKPPEELELRVFAAMHLEKMVKASPYGVTFNFHQITTDKGPTDVLYAVKGLNAVNKEDVCKTWLRWWSVYGDQYK